MIYTWFCFIFFQILLQSVLSSGSISLALLTAIAVTGEEKPDTKTQPRNCQKTSTSFKVTINASQSATTMKTTSLPYFCFVRIC